MKKSLFTKVLTVLGAAVLTLPAVLGMNNNTVKAAGAVPDSQNVILTKYAYTDGNADTSPKDASGLLTQPDANQKRVAGVGFTVYDVTDAYWNGINAGSFTTSEDSAIIAHKINATENGTKVGDTKFTDANGTINFNALPTSKDGKPAVYIFVEDPDTASDYTATQPDFMITLPVKVDGAYPSDLYVYPKNVAKNTLDLEFVKKDSETGAILGGAEFKITKKDENGNTLYAQVVDAKDNTVTGFSKTPVEVKWVSDPNAATKFVSDDKYGKFGFTSFGESVLNGTTYGLKGNGEYGYVETKAPNGYDGGAKGTINENADVLDVKNTPTGILPHTGGKGIVAFVVAGVALIALGGLAYSKRRAA